ncbi:AraC family transcriptional regulator [Paenibacillus sp. BC26]|uniref:AraC family transcriptional regulator n=1 Tax=Paenibacillus sp. BC26 TaxID=1881032 RepID=UPI0008F27D53|nr:AraC family transcriptional regulator [Paenibacillus sp. BC26]SFT13929.1 AraC family transcriptional regulator, cel operon repressor [Paenibacillus sp. BC26]
MLRLTAEGLIDAELETEFYYHRKLQYWTIVHDHEDFYECFLITEGSVYHLVNGVKQLMTEGMFTFIRPTDIHSYERYGDEEVELLNINFRSSMVEEAFAYLGEGFHQRRLTGPLLPPQCTLSPEQAAWLIGQYERINAINTDNKPAIRSAARGLLIGLLVQHFTPPPSDVHPGAPKWLNELLGQVGTRAHLVEGTGALYRLAPYSQEHVCREMRKHLGITPTEWMNEQRLQHAAVLLKQEEGSILNIGLDCGYSSLSYFYKMFSARFAMTPAKYRKLNRKTAIPVRGSEMQLD